ncbi:MAG: hypothetical protein LBG16_02255 [Elusimicrobiota bacterium]|jgi:hypothetical protein|nr:hypothetical protein [Elusimicrobiota bacterium]
MKKIMLLGVFFTLAFALSAQAKKTNNAKLFFDNLKKHCGNAYEGTAIAGGEDPAFAGKTLVMHVRSCGKNEIRIPFFVGEDRSRTWVFTLKGDRILLKHDHRHEDGSPDKVTMYGGLTSNNGTPNLQVFPADQETADLINYAVPNVWWVTTDDNAFTYNLRRVGTERLFTVKFDYSKKISSPMPAPWGAKE